MRTVFPEDFVRRTSFRFRRLPIAAQIALGLAGIWLVQLTVYLATKSDSLGQWLGLNAYPFDPWSLLRLVTYGAVHSVTDPLHVTMNAVVLFLFGSILEQLRGRRAVVESFFLGVVVGGFVFATVVWLRSNPNDRVVGASGGVMGVALATTVAAPNLMTFLRMPLWVLTAIYVALDMVGFALSFRGASSSVAHTAHLGGALAGFLYGQRAMRSHGRAWTDRLRDVLARRRVQRAAARARKLDALLEKIHLHGLPSLSAAERSFLRRASKAAKGGRASLPDRPA